MTFIPKPLSVGTLVTQLWAEVPSALDLDPLKLPEDAPDSLFGEEWDPEEEELTFDLAPLFRRGFDDFLGEDLEDLPRDRRTSGLIDPLPMLGLGDLGERLTGEFGEILRVPEVKGIGGNPEGGTDRLAWYTPFHVDPHRWGIYIREKGLHYLAQQVFEPEGLSYPDGFQKELKKAGSAIQKKWKDKLRQLMTEAINASGLYFKPIPRCPGRFFLRVEDNYRAVLEPVRDGHYLATRVLDHRAYERLLKDGC